MNATRVNRLLQVKGIDAAYAEESLQRPEPQDAGGQTPRTAKCGRRPVFGDVQFPNGQATRYCIIGDSADPEVFFNRAVGHLEVWNLEAPRLLLSIMGGAGNMDMDPAAENNFSAGLVRAAKQTGAWIITGGTDSGVMAIIGKAMNDHDKKRTVPCIGITSFGSLRSRWRNALEVKSSEDSAMLRNCVREAIHLADAPTRGGDDRGDENLAGIQEHHTHSILCDGGKRGPTAFGQEAKFRAAFERHVGRMFRRASPGRSISSTDGSWSLSSRPTLSRRFSVASSMAMQAMGTVKRQGSELEDGQPQLGAEALRVMILLNGGAVSFESVDLALSHECPVVVCRGSGRAADFLAALKDSPGMDYEQAWREHMTAAADAKLWTERWSKGSHREILDRIIDSDRVVVYSSSDRVEDVVIGAVLKTIWARGGSPILLRDSLRRSLDLAVCWQCNKQCRDLCMRLVAVELELGTDDDACPHKAAAWIWKRMTTKEWSEADPSHLARLLFECFPAAMKQFPIVELDPNFDSGGAGTGPEDSVARLLLWLVEHGAPTSAVDALWMQQAHPAHAALAVASAYRRLAKRRSTGYHLGISIGERMLAKGDRYERLAIRLVEGLDQADPVEYLFRHAREWNNHNLVTFAHHLECNSFLMEQFYTSAVDLLWYTPAPFEEYYFAKRKRASLMGVSLVEIALGSYRRYDESNLDFREFWSVPKVKALTHGLSRMLFIFLYSWYVLYSSGVSATLFRLLLFLWGTALGLVEALQIRGKRSFADYINIWNVLDLFLIIVLLTATLSEWLLVPWLLRPIDVHLLHALNLLPCYLRLLQMFELSEYFGTLLITIIDMYADTANFLVLLSVVSLGFSCALTPILWPSTEERWAQGVFWTFWAIFGDTDEKGKEYSDQRSVFAFLVLPLLRYLLYFTLNVLLVNLLIAMLSDTFAGNKEKSKRTWAFQCVDAVLEFASPEAHRLPPPLDLLESWRELRSAGDSAQAEEGGCYLNDGMQDIGRLERRSMALQQQRLLAEESVGGSGASDEREAANSMLELERRLRTSITQMEVLASSTDATLREEVNTIKQNNFHLKQENGRLQRLLDAKRAEKPVRAADADEGS